MSDKVNHPDYYNKGGIECIEAIKSSMSLEGYKGSLKFNVIKYLWRYESKEDPLQDLEKAEFYLTKLIDVILNEQE